MFGAELTHKTMSEGGVGCMRLADLVSNVLINKLFEAKCSTQVGSALRGDIHMGTCKNFSCSSQMCIFSYV